MPRSASNGAEAAPAAPPPCAGSDKAARILSAPPRGPEPSPPEKPVTPRRPPSPSSISIAPAPRAYAIPGRPSIQQHMRAHPRRTVQWNTGRSPDPPASRSETPAPAWARLRWGARSRRHRIVPVRVVPHCVGRTGASASSGHVCGRSPERLVSNPDREMFGHFPALPTAAPTASQSPPRPQQVLRPLPRVPSDKVFLVARQPSLRARSLATAGLAHHQQPPGKSGLVISARSRSSNSDGSRPPPARSRSRGRGAR